MNEQFLDEVWTHITASLGSATCYWADYQYRGDSNEVVEFQEGLWRDGKKIYTLRRCNLKKDLRKLYDIATERLWSGSDSYFQDWGNNVVAGIATQDIAEWDDEVVDVFVQVSLLGEIVYG